MRQLVISGLKISLVLRMKMGIQLVLMESLMQMTVQTWVISCLTFTYGLNFSSSWKNFDLSLFIQGVSGNEIMNTNIYDLEGMARLFGGTRVLDRWTPSNTDTDVPRAVTGDPNGNSRVSSRFVEDGSYMRIKNLTVGYTIPDAALTGFCKRSHQQCAFLCIC
jgi:hypothetical protein